jgi:hypothetical protein
MSSLRNVSNNPNDAILEVFKKEGLTHLNGKDLVKCSDNKEDDPRRFNNFNFLLERFTQKELELLKVKVPNIQQILISIVKLVGYNKEYVINFVSGFIKNIDVDKEHIDSQ